MKLVSGVMIRTIMGEAVAVTYGEAHARFNGMIKLNATAEFIARRLQEETDEASVVRALCEEFDVDADTARESVRKVVDSFASAGLLEA
ncbi:MAG: PqqD family protein [Oscillibacter sp.]|nr:PqqD family protein [Oscillibacter sp.]